MNRLPTVISAAALLIGGTVEAADPGLSAALFAAGFILLGVWAALEVLAHKRRDRHHTTDSEGNNRGQETNT